jgi:hypothetical protein
MSAHSRVSLVAQLQAIRNLLVSYGLPAKSACLDDNLVHALVQVELALIRASSRSATRAKTSTQFPLGVKEIT